MNEIQLKVTCNLQRQEAATTGESSMCKCPGVRNALPNTEQKQRVAQREPVMGSVGGREVSRGREVSGGSRKGLHRQSGLPALPAAVPGCPGRDVCPVMSPSLLVSWACLESSLDPLDPQQTHWTGGGLGRKTDPQMGRMDRCTAVLLGPPRSDSCLRIGAPPSASAPPPPHKLL